MDIYNDSIITGQNAKLFCKDKFISEIGIVDQGLVNYCQPYLSSGSGEAYIPPPDVNINTGCVEKQYHLHVIKFKFLLQEEINIGELIENGISDYFIGDEKCEGYAFSLSKNSFVDRNYELRKLFVHGK